MKTVQTMKSYGNYQNCTIVRPHIPHSYGTYVTLAPKVLVFPIFVQVSLGCDQCPGWGQAAMPGSPSQQVPVILRSGAGCTWHSAGSCLKGNCVLPKQFRVGFFSPLQLSNLALGTCLGQEKVSQLLGFRANFGLADQCGSS